MGCPGSNNTCIVDLKKQVMHFRVQPNFEYSIKPTLDPESDVISVILNGNIVKNQKETKNKFIKPVSQPADIVNVWPSGCLVKEKKDETTQFLTVTFLSRTHEYFSHSNQSCNSESSVREFLTHHP